MVSVEKNVFLVKYIHTYITSVRYLASRKWSVFISLQGVSTIRAARRTPSATLLRDYNQSIVYIYFMIELEAKNYCSMSSKILGLNKGRELNREFLKMATFLWYLTGWCVAKHNNY